MAAGGHFGFQIFSKIDRVLHSGLSMAVSNMNLIDALLSQLQALACGGGVQTKTIIPPKFQIPGI